MSRLVNYLIKSFLSLLAVCALCTSAQANHLSQGWWDNSATQAFFGLALGVDTSKVKGKYKFLGTDESITPTFESSERDSGLGVGITGAILLAHTNWLLTGELRRPGDHNYSVFSYPADSDNTNIFNRLRVSKNFLMSVGLAYMFHINTFCRNGGCPRFVLGAAGSPIRQRFRGYVAEDNDSGNATAIDKFEKKSTKVAPTISAQMFFPMPHHLLLTAGAYADRIVSEDFGAIGGESSQPYKFSTRARNEFRANLGLVYMFGL